MKITIDLADYRKNRMYAVLEAYIKLMPNCNLKEIAQDIGISYDSCRKHIKGMEEAGMVNVTRNDFENPHSWIEGIVLNENHSRN